MSVAFDVNGVQTLAFDPAHARALRTDPALESQGLAPEFVRLFGVAPDFVRDQDADEDEERTRLTDLEFEAALAQWCDVWPELLRAARAGEALGYLPSAALYAHLVEVGARVGRPIDVPVERRGLVTWLLAEGLPRWLGPSAGLEDLVLDPAFRPYTLHVADVPARLQAARPAAEVVGWCPAAAADASAAFYLGLLVEGTAKNLRLAPGDAQAVAVLPNFVRTD